MRIRPADPPPATLALVAGLAFHDSLTPFAPGLALKWPNDLMAGSAKLAGVLLEREEDFVIAGFGANLAEAPVVPGRAVMSLRAVAGESPRPETVLDILVRRFATRLADWRAEGVGPIRDAWQAAAHPVGTRLVTDLGEGEYFGLDEQGALLLKTDDGSVRMVSAGDVFLL